MNTSSKFEDSFGNDSDVSVGVVTSKETSDSESSGPNQIDSVNCYDDRILMEYSIGTVEVHVENLIPPHPSRASRVLDHEHVRMLTDSFMDNSCGQIVIIQGMLVDTAVPHSTLVREGTGEIEVLGGNHSRAALQSLYRKGSLPFCTVRCHLFRPLPRIIALRIGYSHNIVLHEKNKPVTFMDKARLIRDCRPSTSTQMTQEENVRWKDTLVTVLGLKDRRKLVQVYGIHLAMAKLEQELWAKVCVASEKTSFL